MVPEVPDDGEAKRRFVAQINDLSRRSRLQGPARDSAALLAAIVAENEAECLRMETDLLDQGDPEMPRSDPASS